MSDNPRRSNAKFAANEVGRGGELRAKLTGRLVDEARRFVVMFLYLWALFGLFVLNERLVLHARGIGVTWQGVAFINALVLAKVMLFAEDADLGRWLPRRPLIYRIVLDSLLLSIFFIGFHLAERAIVGHIRGETGAEHGLAMDGGGAEGYLIIAVILFISLTPFFAFRHISRELGGGRLQALLFGADG